MCIVRNFVNRVEKTYPLWAVAILAAIGTAAIAGLIARDLIQRGSAPFK